MPTDPEQARFLAIARGRRLAWDRFQASNRRIALRDARADPTTDLDTVTDPSPATRPGLNR